jgi:hypothetical protein
VVKKASKSVKKELCKELHISGGDKALRDYLTTRYFEEFLSGYEKERKNALGKLQNDMQYAMGWRIYQEVKDIMQADDESIRRKIHVFHKRVLPRFQ